MEFKLKKSCVLEITLTDGRVMTYSFSDNLRKIVEKDLKGKLALDLAHIFKRLDNILSVVQEEGPRDIHTILENIEKFIMKIEKDLNI